MAKAHLKTGFVERLEVVDTHTGELLSSDIKEHRYLAATKEGFFLAYAELIGVFTRMTQAEIRTFGYCLRFRNAKFDLTKKLRVVMSKDIDLNERTIANTLPLLLDKGVLLKYDDGLYQVSPRYVFHGSSSERNEQLKIVLELGLEPKN